MAGTCTTPAKTKFYRVTSLPDKLDPGAWYLVESNPADEFVDLYTSDRSGRKKVIIDSDRISRFIVQPTPSIDPSLITYESDIEAINYYYYGYEYDNNTWKIIRVQIGNVVNQNKNLTMSGTFNDDWVNRTTIAYN